MRLSLRGASVSPESYVHECLGLTQSCLFLSCVPIRYLAVLHEWGGICNADQQLDTMSAECPVNRDLCGAPVQWQVPGRTSRGPPFVLAWRAGYR